jgi:hypothetical protein
MLVEITNVEVSALNIILEANAIENVIMADDLFEDVEIPKVVFSFDRKAKNGCEMRYLWTICANQRRCESATSFGGKLEKLKGAILQINETFRIG